MKGIAATELDLAQPRDPLAVIPHHSLEAEF